MLSNLVLEDFAGIPLEINAGKLLQTMKPTTQSNALFAILEMAVSNGNRLEAQLGLQA